MITVPQVTQDGMHAGCFWALTLDVGTIGVETELGTIGVETELSNILILVS